METDRMRGRLVARELLARSPVLAGGSWEWQLRDRLGQWMDMNSDVEWVDRGKKRHGYVVGSPAEGIATVQLPGVNARQNVSTARLTALGPPPVPKVDNAPSTPPRPKIPRKTASLSDEQLAELYWASKDHPDVPTREFLRVAWEVYKRKIDVDPHAYPTAEVFASGAIQD